MREGTGLIDLVATLPRKCSAPVPTTTSSSPSARETWPRVGHPAGAACSRRIASNTGVASAGVSATISQDLGHGRLLLQRLLHLAVALLQLVEQPRVLDRDDRLVGEGFEQRHLARCEGDRLSSAQEQMPDGLPSENQRRAEACPPSVTAHYFV